jgi:hypothetical protein
MILKLDADAEDWIRYIDDAQWLGEAYWRAGDPIRAAMALRAGREKAFARGLDERVRGFDITLDSLVFE